MRQSCGAPRMTGRIDETMKARARHDGERSSPGIEDPDWSMIDSVATQN